MVNISIAYSGYSDIIQNAIDNSFESGVTYVVAAGNNNFDACNISPARVPNAITVGGSSSGDVRMGYSNYGRCVDIFAPGQSILSTHSFSDTATATLSGTSMASPHVAGAAALFLETNPSASPAEVEDALVSSATSGVLSDVGHQSPNKLLYSRFGTGGPTPTPTPTPAATPTPTPRPQPTPSAPGQITIRKRGNAYGNGSTSVGSFQYNAINLAVSNFTLYNSGAPEDTFVDPNVNSFGTANIVEVTEAQVAGWSLDSIECTETSGSSQPNTIVNLANRKASIVVEPGEQVTCTFTSNELGPTAADATISGMVVDTSGRAVKNVTVSLIMSTNGSFRYARTNVFGRYAFDSATVIELIMSSGSSHRGNIRSLTALGHSRYTKI